MKQRCCV